MSAGDGGKECVARSQVTQTGAWSGCEGAAGVRHECRCTVASCPRCGGSERSKASAAECGLDWWEPRVQPGGRWSTGVLGALPLGEWRAAHGSSRARKHLSSVSIQALESLKSDSISKSSARHQRIKMTSPGWVNPLSERDKWVKSTLISRLSFLRVSPLAIRSLLRIAIIRST
jgi:hypothetical protein